MKKILGIMLALTTIIMLLSCKKKEYVAHVFYFDYANEYVTEIRNELERELKAANINFQSYNGQNSQAHQNAQIDTAIINGANILVINLVDSNTAESVSKKAEKKKIPVVIFNRQPKDREFMKGKKDIIMLDGMLQHTGEIQGEMIADYVLKNYDKVDRKKDGYIDYIMITGNMSAEGAQARTRYSVLKANELLEKAGKPKLRRVPGSTVDLNSDWNADKAKIALTTLITTNVTVDTIDLIICNNDAAASGAIKALNDVGYNRGYDENKNLPEKHVTVFGFDATKDGRNLIKEGKLNGTILQPIKENVRIIKLIINNHISKNENYIAGDDTLKYVDGYNRLVLLNEIYDPKLHGE